MVRSPWRRLVPLLFAAGLALLHAPSFRAPFLNDDLLFLEQARSVPLVRSLGSLDALGNFWRPLSRQVYFAVLGSAGGADPRVFHLFNFALFLGALVLLADLLGAFTGGLARLAGVLFFALLPLQTVNLLWISCAQDLLALVFTLGALALWRRERRGLAVLAWVAALASKESALPLPIVLFAWDAWVARRDLRDAALRQAPMLVAAAVWGVLGHLVRTHAHPHAPLAWRLDGVAAAYVHLAQSLLGIEDPRGFVAGFSGHFPAVPPLVLLAAAGWLAGSPASKQPAAAAPAPDATGAVRFGLAWIVAFGIVTWPVVAIWSGYYFTLAAAGGALLVAVLARRLGRVGWIALSVALLWWNAAATSVPGFAVAPDPWGWTSHLTPAYFRREDTLIRELSASLERVEPAPPHDTRFYFVRLPSYAGFQMGNGALIRRLYRDPSLESYFYSRFDETTAGQHPCRFLWWDGAAIRPLYPGTDDPFFQVGCDLLLLDLPRGATHAFRRSLAAGGNREDALYWLGWSLLWSGERDAAETAWGMSGAHDDSVEWNRNFTAVRTTLYERRDTLAARRELLAAIRAGIGQPHPHAILGELMLARGGIETKYGLLELLVARRLNPRDLLARRELVLGLASIGLDERALDELDAMKPLDAGWRADSTLVALERRLRVASAPVRVITAR